MTFGQSMNKIKYINFTQIYIKMESKKSKRNYGGFGGFDENDDDIDFEDDDP